MNACPSILQRDVREDSLRWLLPAYVFLGSLVALLDETTAPPPSLTAMGMSILLLSGIAWLVRARNEPLAAWLLALGSLALVVLSWLWFPDIEAHSLLLLPIVVALVSLGAKAALATAAPAMAALAFVGLASGPTAGLWITAGFVCLATFCLLMAEQAWATMLTMLWQNYEQACQHLEEARDRQVQLKQALEDLDLANREVIRLNDLLIAAREAVEEARRA
ncbi:MAG: hypothetical protein H5T69_16960, partial [Chloroflexi bacterium]|nr:hypothetical protein [Chloroflexota bacterium]